MRKMRRIGWGLLLVNCLAWGGETGQAGSDSSNPKIDLSPGATAAPVIRAAGRGNPWINVTDGRPVTTRFPAGSRAARQIADGSAKPLALASADFDEDGVPDLASSFAAGPGGFFTLHRGNVDAIYPNSPEAKTRRASGTFVDAPFLPDARSFDTMEPPDFVVAGDFDADGHWDVIIASRGGGALFLHPGDGHGGFEEAKKNVLPGSVTAMIAGDINRRDGLTDLVIGVDDADGARALIFEGPDGALTLPPEAFDLPSPAGDLALGQFGGAGETDLIITADATLTVMLGRDRRLSQRDDRRAEAPLPVLQRFTMPFTITSMATGFFDGGREVDVALLDRQGMVHVGRIGELQSLGADETSGEAISSWSGELFAAAEAGDSDLVLYRARLSDRRGDNLLLLHRSGQRLHLRRPGCDVNRVEPRNESRPRGEWTSFDLAGEPVSALPMRLNADALSDLVVLSSGEEFLSTIETDVVMTFEVTNTNASGPGSLDQAILDANGNPGADLITFNIPGPGPHTIQPLGIDGLPRITDPVTIDATSDPDVVEVDGTLGPDYGLRVEASNTAIRGLVVSRFLVSGLYLGPGTANIRIEGCWIGTDAAGTSPAGNGSGMVVNSLDTTIGGTAAAARNVISGNLEEGILVTFDSGLVIQGNYIGTDVGGNSALQNGIGGAILLIDAPNATIGGTGAGAGNLISGNYHEGIYLASSSPGAVVQGNRIGTNAAGLAAIGNGREGVRVVSSSNTIGGTTPAARNIISGNQDNGMVIYQGDSNLVQGNYIGTVVGGEGALGNAMYGIFLRGPNNVIGGNTPSARNVISGNLYSGIIVSGYPESTGNDIMANYVGTGASGGAAVWNGRNGIRLQGDDNRIGGASITTANVLSGNQQSGINLDTGSGNLIEMNLIGTNATGNFAVGNGSEGIRISGGANNTLIGVKAGQANVISGNAYDGILIFGGSSGIRLQGNIIGLNAAGSSPLPNAGSGIHIMGVSGNFIGGAAGGLGNTISGNGANGVTLQATTDNLVQNNRIGATPDGALSIPNAGAGLSLTDGASMNTIGGLSLDAGNIITGNLEEGVRVESGSSNAIRGNAIHGNVLLGIDLWPSGVSPNDPVDGDGGANNLQNFPVLSSVSTTGGSVLASGSLPSLPSSAFDIDFYRVNFCHTSGHGEGQEFLGSASVTTDATGDAAFDVTLIGNVPAGGFLTATATDSDGNTSEFSACATAVGIPPAGTSGVLWDPTGLSRIMWDVSPGADLYNVYVGGPATLAHLLDKDPDSCQQTTVQQGATFVDIPAVQNPPLGQALWWIIRPQNPFGEGDAGEGAAGIREHNSTGACGASCAHDKGLEGIALVPACDPCVSIICAADTSCCNNSWDVQCVQEVRTICNSLTTAESQGTCDHPLCITGEALPPKCDDPPVSPSCVEAICTNDSFCCTNAWDDLCVLEVATVCNLSCL